MGKKEKSKKLKNAEKQLKAKLEAVEEVVEEKIEAVKVKAKDKTKAKDKPKDKDKSKPKDKSKEKSKDKPSESAKEVTPDSPEPKDMPKEKPKDKPKEKSKDKSKEASKDKSKKKASKKKSPKALKASENPEATTIISENDPGWPKFIKEGAEKMKRQAEKLSLKTSSVAQEVLTEAAFAKAAAELDAANAIASLHAGQDLPPYDPTATYSSEDDGPAGEKHPVVVEFLALDLGCCDRCQGTDKRVESAIEMCREALAACGYEIFLNTYVVTDEAMAEEHRFYSSPTIRVNGVDICPSIEENDCACCGEMSDSEVKCRLYPFNGTYYEVPPTAMIVQGILDIVFSGLKASPADEPYELPENLAVFFEGVRKKAEGCCAENAEGESEEPQTEEPRTEEPQTDDSPSEEPQTKKGFF